MEEYLVFGKSPWGPVLSTYQDLGLLRTCEQFGFCIPLYLCPDPGNNDCQMAGINRSMVELDVCNG